MKALGNYILSGRFKSVAMISLLTILSLLFPPLSYIISGAPFGLVTLRKGGVEGLYLLLGLFLITSIFGNFSRIGFGLGATFAGSVWLPVWASSMVLRMTESQGLTVLAAGGIGILFILVLAFFNEELTEWWQNWSDTIIENYFTGDEGMQMREILEGVFPLLSGIVSAGIVISLITTVLLARAWQSAMFNPGGFRAEFHRLLLPRWMIFVTLLCLILSMAGMEDISWLARNILAVLVVLFVFQGIAGVHRIVHARRMSKNWLIVMYCFLLFIPQMAIFLACIGIVDVLNRGKKTMPNDGE
jgi:hypothetical protein